jgi:hypothetical protein
MFNMQVYVIYDKYDVYAKYECNLTRRKSERKGIKGRRRRKCRAKLHHMENPDGGTERNHMENSDDDTERNHIENTDDGTERNPNTMQNMINMMYMQNMNAISLVENSLPNSHSEVALQLWIYTVTG